MAFSTIVPADLEQDGGIDDNGKEIASTKQPDDAAFARSYILVSVSILTFLLVLGIPSGHLLGVVGACGWPCLVRICFRTRIGSGGGRDRSFGGNGGGRNRSFGVDLFRGSVLQHIVTFHLGWDLEAAHFINLCSRGSDGLFILLVVVGHAAVITCGRYQPEIAGELMLGFLSWGLVSGMRSNASRMGMCLMMFTAGYTSMMQYQKARGVRSFIWKGCRHFLLVGCGALSISVITYLENPRSFICFGSLHLLACGGLASLPFVAIPRAALIFGVFLIVGRLTHVVPHWQVCTGKDMQPTVLAFGFQLVGIGSQRYGMLDLLLGHLQHRSGRAVGEWLGRNALSVFLLHQVILFPLTTVLGKIVSTERRCLAEWLWELIWNDAKG